MDQCRWIKDEDGDEVFIPGCFGAAHGPIHCTCKVEGSRIEKLEEALYQAERKLEKAQMWKSHWHDMYQRGFRRNHELTKIIRRMKAEQTAT